MADIKAIAEELVNLTVKEVNELATVLKDEYGIEPAAAAVAVAAGPAAGGAAAAEEKSTFDVVLAEVGGAKLQVVKAVKEACGLGLKDLPLCRNIRNTRLIARRSKAIRQMDSQTDRRRMESFCP